MPDQLYLSYRLHGYSAQTVGRQFEKMVRAFPLSKLSQAPLVLRVNAVSFDEPPLYEQAYEPAAGFDPALADAAEFFAPDCAATLEAHWELWQHFDDWKLQPARVALFGFGPEFEGEQDDHLRIDLGIDTHYLPQQAVPNALFMAQSNVRSLLHLVHELDNLLPVANRRLWTESGENFAERLAALLTEQKPGPRLV